MQEHKYPKGLSFIKAQIRTRLLWKHMIQIEMEDKTVAKNKFEE